MSSRRVLKAAQAIREVVGMAIIADLKDPRIRDVTVTLVEVSPDMRNAKVNVSVMGDETKQRLCIKGLQSSAGYLQSRIGRRIETRYTPRLLFVLDEGHKNSLLVTRILEEVLPKEREEREPLSGDAVTTDEAVNAEAAEAAEAAETAEVGSGEPANPTPVEVEVISGVEPDEDTGG